MNATRLATYVSLPVLGLLSALGHYGGRTGWWLVEREAGIDVSTLSVAASGAAILGAIFAGGMGALAGGAATASVGLLMAAIGGCMVGSGALVTGAVVGTVGWSFTSVGLIAAAVRAFDPRASSHPLALLMGVYLVTNVGAMLGPVAGASIADMLGGGTAQLALAGVLAFAFLVSLPLSILSFLSPPEVEAHASAPASAVAVVAALVGCLGWLAWNTGGDLQWNTLARDGSETAWLFAVNPAVVVLVALLGGSVCIGLGLSGVELPAFVVAGLGLLVSAVGLALTPALAPMGVSGFLGLQLVGGIGEPLAFAGLYASVTGIVHWRVAPVMVALLHLAAALSATMTGLYGMAGGPDGWGAVGCGLVVGLVGAGASAAAWPVRRLLAEE